MLFQFCLCQVTIIRFVFVNCNMWFWNQPKDTQQALSRKESAVNMEKFKKFAARRKWKVSMENPSLYSLNSKFQLQEWQVYVRVSWGSYASHFQNMTLGLPVKQRNHLRPKAQCHYDCCRLAIAITLPACAALVVFSLSVLVRHSWPSSAPNLGELQRLLSAVVWQCYDVVFSFSIKYVEHWQLLDCL